MANRSIAGDAAELPLQLIEPSNNDIHPGCIKEPGLNAAIGKLASIRGRVKKCIERGERKQFMRRRKIERCSRVDINTHEGGPFEIDQLSSVPHPSRKETAMGRDLPLPVSLRERHSTHLVMPRFVCRIGEPPSVPGESRIKL